MTAVGDRGYNSASPKVATPAPYRVKPLKASSLAEKISPPRGASKG